jgi:adenosylcobyric acid synthase
MHDLSIFGTSSDAGKSTFAFAIALLLQRRGISVAPFKAQNVSNNAQVCDEGGEIAQPQYFTAEALGIASSSDMNPVLIKSGNASKAHLIVQGKSVGERHVLEYYRDIDTLKPIVSESFKRLKKRYECIVAEGAGSPVELNLMDRDLSNLYIAKTFQTKIIIIADIERGGVFASIYGLYNLLPDTLKPNVIGVIINKFRGDRSLFDEGIEIIQNRFGLKVLGVVGYRPFNLGFEDAQSLSNYVQKTHKTRIKAGVITYPHLSNYTDLEPLIADDEVSLLFIDTPSQAALCDVLILPGSKQVASDLQWLRECGFEPILHSFKGIIVAICGGYEMLHERLLDPKKVESSTPIIKGIGRIKGDVRFKRKKVLKKGTYKLFGTPIKGYEIHNGRAEKLGIKQKNLYATFVHGLFDSDAFRHKLFKRIDKHYKGYNFKKYKRNAIAHYADYIETQIDMQSIIKAMTPKELYENM